MMRRPVRRKAAGLRIFIILLDNGQPVGQAQVAGKIVFIVIRGAAFIDNPGGGYQNRPAIPANRRPPHHCGGELSVAGKASVSLHAEH